MSNALWAGNRRPCQLVRKRQFKQRVQVEGGGCFVCLGGKEQEMVIASKAKPKSNPAYGQSEYLSDLRVSTFV